MTYRTSGLVHQVLNSLKAIAKYSELTKLDEDHKEIFSEQELSQVLEVHVPRRREMPNLDSELVRDSFGAILVIRLMERVFDDDISSLWFG